MMPRIAAMILAVSFVAVLGVASLVLLILSPKSEPVSEVQATSTSTLTADSPLISPRSDEAEIATDVLESESRRIRNAILSVVGVRADDGSGTGFAVATISTGTVVVTCAHVVADSERLSVILPDGTEHAATVLSVDGQTDLALILLEDAHGIPVLPLQDAATLSVADRLFVVGFALGTELLGDPTVTQGILSGRRMIGEVDYLQTDAVMNPGNSGGPVLNVHGEVVGVASWGLRSDHDAPVEGLNFATPSNYIEVQLSDLQLD